MTAIPSKKAFLYLNRFKGESFFIGEGDDAVEVQVARLTNRKCTLHVYAPPHVKVDRAERRIEKS